MIVSVEGYLGKSIGKICTYYGTAPHTNNCAHFVSHVLQYRLPGAALCSNVNGTTCSYEDRHVGFCIRVDEVYNSLKNRGYWPTAMPREQKIAVATTNSDILDKGNFSIGTNPRKHIGIFSNGLIYNFSNSHHQVKQSSVSEFSRIYGTQTIMLIADMP